MRMYRCYFLDERNRIEAADWIEADGLEEAIDAALTAVEDCDAHAVEIWEGPQRLYPTTMADISA